MKYRIILLSIIFCFSIANAIDLRQSIYPVGKLKPIDSTMKLKIGSKAPDFSLKALDGTFFTLAQFRGKKNVAISFVPAAWTPICSGQWPGYNVIQDVFDKNDTILLGISVDNTPTLYAWTKAMGTLWFPVLSDFYPHGQTAQKYGVLRKDGTSERAIFMIDKKGIIRYIDVHDINQRPRLEDLAQAMQKANTIPTANPVAQKPGVKKKPVKKVKKA